jgi:hypothetical protein
MADNKTSDAGTKTSKVFENLAPLLGLGASIGAQIPGLKKGLRAAGNIAREGALAAAKGAAADEAQYVQERDARNERLAGFGKDVGEMSGMLATGITQSRQAREAEMGAGEDAEMQMLREQAALLMPTYGQVAGVDEVTGLKQDEVQQLSPLQEQEVGPGPTLDQTDQYGDSEMDQTAGAGVPELSELAMDPAIAELGIADKETLYSIAPELELQHRLENLALDEAYRTGANITRIYARLRRSFGSPAIDQTIDMNRQLQLQQPMGGQ